MERLNTGRIRVSRAVRTSVCVAVLTMIFLLAVSGVAFADVWTDISDTTWQSVYHVSAADAFTVAEGYPNHTFRPDQAVTRGQFAKMAVDGLNIDYYDPAVPSFSDVPRVHIFYQYIEGAVAAEIISGYPEDNTFRPQNNIIRQQTNKILGTWLAQEEIASIDGIQGAHGFYPSLAAWYAAEGEDVLAGFADRLQIAPVHRPATAYLVMRGVVLGSSSGTATLLKPLNELTRAQAVTMVLRTRDAMFERTPLHLQVSGISNPSVSGAASSVTVTVLDDNNAPVTGYTGTIHFTSTDPFPAALPANYTFTALDAGTHTFVGGVTLKTAGSQTVTATDTVTASITGGQTVTVISGAATKVVIETAATSSGTPVADATVTAGSHIDVYANSHDANNNFVANVAATWSLSNLDPTTGAVAAGDLVPVTGNKSAVFTGHLVGTGKINAVVSGLTSGITGTITVVPGTATKVVIETAATSSGTPVVDATVTSAGHIDVYANSHDANNNFVANVVATWSLSSLNPATGGIVADDLVPAGNDKSAVFTGLLVGTGKINAVVSGLTSGITGTITVVPGTATKVVIETAATSSGTPVVDATVTSAGHIDVYANSHDASNNFVANVAASWSLSNLSPTTGGIVADDLVPVTGNKSAVFTGHLVGTGKINAAVSGLTSGITGTVRVIASAGDATQSTLTASPATVTADASTTSTVTATLKDANGNPVAGKTVALAKTSGPGTPIISAASGPSSASGVVTFTVKSTTAGADTFTATDTTDSVTITQTATVTFTAGPATQIAVNVGNSQDATVGATVAIAPSVIVKDVNNNPVSGVSVTFAVATGDGSGTGLTATTDASGIATVGSWTLGPTAGSNTMTATSGSLSGSPVTFTATGIAAG